MFGQIYVVWYFVLVNFLCFSIRPSSQAVLKRAADWASDINNINKRSNDQIAENKPPLRINTHHHIVPDFYAQLVQAAGGNPLGVSDPTWSVEQDTEHMAQLGVVTAIVSVSSPGTKIYENDTTLGRNLARQLNEFSAELVKNNSKQYGFFASLPSFSDVEGCLNEIDYCDSVLKPDGYALFTSYGIDYKYLGNSLFHPIWAKLNGLKTVVFIHPNEAPITLTNSYLSPVLIDYPQETTRTVADLVLTGTRTMFPDVRIILAHAGGTLPFLAYRISVAALSPTLNVPLTQTQILEAFSTFYFDTALSSFTPQLDALLAFADQSQILFGSDDPFAPFPLITEITNTLDTYFLENKNDTYKQIWQDINYNNAKALFPNKVTD